MLTCHGDVAVGDRRLMAVALALVAAATFGVSDFLAGMSSRRISYVVVGLVSQSSATALVWAALATTSSPRPTAHALAWGLVSGVGGGVGSLALYRGLGHGQMAVVGPLSAVGSAALPAVVGIALGDRPSALAVTGVLLAMPAVWLVSRSPRGRSGPSATGVADGLVAGAGFGLLFIGLARAGDAAGLWPVAVGQSVSMLLQIGVVANRRPARPNRRAVILPAVVGVMSISATLLYFLATHHGLLVIVAVLTSLYPGVTVLLAALLLRERIAASQRLGLGLCVAAVIAIAST